VEIFWLASALDDLAAIHTYIAADNPGAALEIHERVVRRVRDLVANPHSGRPGRVPGTRELVLAGTPYLVAYRVRRQRLEILAVLHGARDWPETFG